MNINAPVSMRIVCMEMIVYNYFIFAYLCFVDRYVMRYFGTSDFWLLVRKTLCVFVKYIKAIARLCM